jgi:WD40 repeat protein
MSRRLTCAAGHQWEAADDGTAGPGAGTVCPQCGAAAAVDGTASAILKAMPVGSWPHLGTPAEEDSAATIAVEPGQTLPAGDPVDYEVTLPPLQGVAPAVRESVPGYEILAVLGRGGMGVVYKARRVELGRIVALKMVLAGVHLSPRDLERFKSEAAAVARLQHPHIVQLYEFGEHDGRPYFSLEFVEGGSLHQRLKGEPLPTHLAAELTEKLARAVHYAHERGIVHRDIKPGNILLTADGEPKLTDFGLAKQVRVERGQTQTGTVLGTPSYMAPEQALGKSRDVGPTADVYALGAILYEMLTGRPPFRAETPLDTLMQVASEEPVPLSRLQPRLPQDLQTICMTCLQKEAHKRYLTAEGLADDLQRFIRGEPIAARPIGRLERVYKWARRRPAAAALVLLLFFTVVAGFTGVVWRWRLEAEQRARLEAAQQETAAALVRAENSLYCNRIALAEREWLANNVARARLLLRDCRSDLRGWEWHYLNHLCHADLLTLRGHDSPICGLSFSPDGQQLVSAGVDQTVKVWDGSNGKIVFTQTGPGTRDRSATVAFTHDGRQVLYAGAQQILQAWDARTGKELRTMNRSVAKASCSAFSPERRRLAFGAVDGSITVWDVGVDKETTLRGHTGSVLALAFGPNGKLLVSAGQDGAVKVWDASGGTVIRPLVGHTSPVHGVAFSPEGRRVASAGADTTVRVWEALSGKLLSTFRGHHQPVSCVVFSPNGQLCASAGRDHVIMIWDAATGEELFRLRGHTDAIHCLAFRRDGKLLASAGEDRLVKVWDATTGQDARMFKARFASNCVAFAPNGQYLATADNHIQIWDAATTAPVYVLGGSAELIRSMAYHPDGKRLATAGAALKVRDAATGRELLSLGRPTAAHYRSVTFSPDGHRLASGGDDGIVRVFDADNGQELLTLKGHEGAVLGVAFSPDGQRLASASGDRAVRLWSASNGAVIRVLTGHTGRLNSVAFSPGGRYLASGGEGQGDRDGDGAADGELKIWDTATGDARYTLWGHSGPINSVVFTPDGERLASGSDDQTVKLWDPEFGQEVLTLRGHTGAVQGLAFSPDGHILASIAADQTVRLWNAMPLP